MMKLLKFFILWCFSFSSQAFAWPATYGSEFNFTNPKVSQGWLDRRTEARRTGSTEWQYPDDAEQAAADLMAEKVKELCGDACKIIRNYNGKFGTEYRVLFIKEQWGFNISLDPGVVEIQTRAETAEDIGKNIKLYQFIFNAAKAANLQAQQQASVVGGVRFSPNTAHFNIGFKSAFENDPVSFLRFFIDYAQNAGLAHGVLDETDMYNSPAIIDLTDEQRQALKQIVDDVNSGEIRSATVVAKRINFDVYTKTPGHPNGDEQDNQHYQAFGLKQLLKPQLKWKDMPFELRAIRQQANAKEYALLVDLIEHRLTYIKSLGGPIEYVPRARLPTEESPLRLAATFYAYVTEMGQSWGKYQSLLMPEVAKELQSGRIQKIFSKQINFANANESQIWNDFVVAGATTSPWRAELIDAVNQVSLAPLSCKMLLVK